MKFLKYFLGIITIICLLSCGNDDNGNQTEINEESFILPDIAILGTDLTTGETGVVLDWEDNFETINRINLQEELDFEIGFLRNIVGSEIALASGFPVEEYLFYDVLTGEVDRESSFFTPNNIPGSTFTTNAGDAILTYYLDSSTSCCDIFLETFQRSSQTSNEVFIGDANISTVQTNVFARGNFSFVKAADIFTERDILYINDTRTGNSIGTLDVDAYEAFLYNDAREEMYLFDFDTGAFIYDALDLRSFIIRPNNELPQGFTLNSGFNDAQFDLERMVFKDALGEVSSIYNFITDEIMLYNRGVLFNIIFEATGTGVSVSNSIIDLDNNIYVVLGTFQENNESKGIVVFLSLQGEVLQALPTGDIRPDEVIFKN